MSNGAKSQSSAKLALAIRQLRSQTDVELLASEPIAIVGIGCRFPRQIASPEDYWRFLTAKKDAITEVPPDRWNSADYYDSEVSAPGKMNGRWGAFLEGVDQFDPVFFGISPREAALMDPQHRIALEVAWDAIHDSGKAPAQMAGTSTGVFIAIYNTDYSRLLFADENSIGPHTCSGASHSMAPGRISYLLDLRGPSVAVDSACSSSLIAIHLAVQSLRSRDCDTALAGGVSLKLSPESYLCLSKMSMLSPDGHCHSFDSEANGFVPGEGCGLVVLKRLSDALAAGDRVRAVIRGSAAGQDGRTASLTAPNGPAQQAVVRAALANAHADPGDIEYVEAHGTGTALGDPIEVEALAEVIGHGSKPCALGTVKSNFGHLEAAAGVAGLIKAALALEKGEIPPNLHFHALNPHISFEGTRFYVPTDTTPWKREAGLRLAGVSSFGFTGTNAHIVLEEPPRIPVRNPPSEIGPYLLTISARSNEALADYVSRYVEFLKAEGRDVPVAEICRNAMLRRDHHEQRLAVSGTTHDELRSRLEAALVDAHRSDPGPIAFVFSGQGSQWARMGVELMKTEPRFADAIRRCDARIREEAGWSLVTALEAGEDSTLLHRTEFAQPAIFALQTALAELWGSWGVKPAFVIGHSVGEIAAAHIAGVLDLSEAVRIAVHRGRLMDAATGRGRMLSVALPTATVRLEIPDSVSIAAVNAPSSTVVSGDPAAIEQLAKAWEARGISVRMLPVDYAFHSAQMEACQAALPHALGPVSTNPPEVTLISTVTGKPAVAGDYNAEYWARNVRYPVQFHPAIECALSRGARCFLEIGPHAVLSPLISECAPAGTAVIGSLRRNRDERTSLVAALGQLYSEGHTIDWKSVFGESRTIVALPAYPYQRTRLWVPEAPKQRATFGPLIGEPLTSPALRGKVWQSTITPEHPLIRGHRIGGGVVFPLAGFLQIAASAWALAWDSYAVTLTDVEIGEALQVAEPVMVQTVVEGARCEIYSLAQDQWRKHTSVQIQALKKPLEPIAAGDSTSERNIDDYYRSMFDSGLEYSPEFQTIRELRAGQGYAEALVSADPVTPFAPALLDGCLQTVLAASNNEGRLYLPVSIDRFDLYRDAGSPVRCRLTSRPTSEEDVFSADFDLLNEAGLRVAAGRGLRMKLVRASQAAYELSWVKSGQRRAAKHRAGRWLVVAEEGSSSEALQLGSQCDRRSATDDLARIEIGGYLGVLYLAGPDTREEAYGRVLKLVQRIAAANATAHCELWLATRNAQRTGPSDECGGHAQAVVWGLARTAALEYPDLRCVRVDLDDSAEAVQALCEEMLAPGEENELAFRARERYFAQVTRVASLSETRVPRRLIIQERGSLDRLAYEAVTLRAPGEEEVEVCVHTSALNFRDVLNALGAYPAGPGGDPGPLGLEFCGRVLRTGNKVTHCKPGDLVMGVGWGAFADVFIARAALVTPVPAGLAPEDAVTLPNTFATAYHCLVTEGRIQKGDRVLIHTAAGGVGMMAVQIALNAGAEVFATAGTEEKREILKARGVQHVFSSRTLDFAAQVNALTNGAGVDLALNSLAGEFIQATLSAVRDHGRFVEIGKTGIWDARDVAALGRDIRYSVVDLGRFLDEEPEVIAGYFRELCARVGTGAIRPLPKRVFDFGQAAEAFRFVAQGKHIGKVVLRHPADAPTFSGTWLLTGGLGSLGLETARWFAKSGASTLVLAGRRAPSPSTQPVLEDLKKNGVSVETLECDVSRVNEVRALVESIRHRHGPLRGIVHLAGTLDDGVLAQQDQGRFEGVYGAKAASAQYLHELTESDGGVNYFILFSSAAALLGSPGQGNYAAANAALDSLANYRAAHGLPAISIEWGAWAGGGMAARAESSARRTMSLLRPVRASDYFDALESALQSGRSNLALMSADWRQWNQLPGRSRTHVVSGVAPERRQDAANVAEATILDQLKDLPSSRRRKVTFDYLHSQVSRILALADSYRIDEHEPLMRLGLDSLMALELRNTLARSFGRSLSATLLFDHTTLGALADYFMGMVDPHALEPKAATDTVLESIEAMSDEEAERLLAAELGMARS